MKSFTEYLQSIGEIGFVEEVSDSIVYVTGLPKAKPNEIILFESGEFGQILSLLQSHAEILLYSINKLRVGTRAVRTGQLMEVPVGEELLGRVITPIGTPIGKLDLFEKPKKTRPIDTDAGGIATRKRIGRPFMTGVTLVDMLIPLGHGQRELVVGDRKTGKTNFLLQTVLSQAQSGTICIYGAIGKKQIDIKKSQEFFKANGIEKQVIIVASSSHDPAGLIFLTPYTAMAIAEYFRDQKKDSVVILDDLTTHAKFYREIALLAKRFPGRNSYPADMFYRHAKLMERSGNFIVGDGEAAITCIPVAETAQGDLSGFIQTNLMSMTDGHLYFDVDLFGKGRRPAVNPFLSVSRVGRQTQTKLRLTTNRELISFLTLFEKMQNFVHFGTEINASIKQTLTNGEKILAFFNQSSEEVLTQELQMFLFCLLWYGVWQKQETTKMLTDMKLVTKKYREDTKVQGQIHTWMEKEQTLNEFLNVIRVNLPSIVKTFGINSDQAPITAPVIAPQTVQAQTAAVSNGKK